MARRWRFKGDGPIEVMRDTHGVPHVRVTTEADLYRGLGNCHAVDRALPMLLLRILGTGRGSEILEASDDMLASDRFFRRCNLAADVEQEVAKLGPDERVRAEAYCEGVNRALAERSPWELRLLGYIPRPWTLHDVVLMSRLAGFIGLAQSQGDSERLFLEMLHADVPRTHLAELFPGLFADADLDLLKRVTLGARLIPESVRWSTTLTRMVASNNWAVAPKKTRDGTAIGAYDPHLETNRLPPIWYEIVFDLPDRWCVAATMPGIPGLLFGRTNDLSWGATYTFMDAIDSWVEDCRDGQYRRTHDGTDHWEHFQTRTEVITRKRKPETTVTFYENEHGVLEGDPHVPGHYLTTCWASGAGTGAASLRSLFGILHAPNVTAGMELLGGVETAWNWVLADRQGNIGYQMSGRMPIRRDGWRGFVPQPGWDVANDWRGFVAARDLPREYNPERGFVATANEDLNHLGSVDPINMPMGPYRADRIAALLAARDDWTVDDCRVMQLDVHSRHADDFLAVLLPLLPDTPEATALRTWDRGYDLESRAATLFERFYRALLIDVFGATCGPDVMEFMINETGILTDFYYNFDRILLSAESVWYGPEGRDATWTRIAAQALPGPVRPWGDERQLVMKHLLLGGRLPRWLGFDHGPIPLRGNRATIHQGQIYRSGGRQTSFAPSLRIVTDLGTDEVHTAMAGGPSDRRFSRWYRTGIPDWIAGRLKPQRPSPK